MKWLVVVDLHRQLRLAQKAHAGPTNDGANLCPLVDTAHTVSAIGLVLANAEFAAVGIIELSCRPFPHIRIFAVVTADDVSDKL